MYHFSKHTISACVLGADAAPHTLGSGNHRTILQLLQLQACKLHHRYQKMPLADSDPYKVQEITHLKGKPKAAEALELLRRVALQVQPIMHKRQLTVRKLSEFIPKSSSLLGLNVNRGAEIKIRLRPPDQDDSFYCWNHVLGTMLHELCHNKVGPHNAGNHVMLNMGSGSLAMPHGLSGSLPRGTAVALCCPAKTHQW